MWIKSLGEEALVICYDSVGDGEPNLQIQSHYNILRQIMPPGITDIVLCFSNIGVYYDITKISAREVRAFIDSSINSIGEAGNNSKIVSIPVYYGGKYGPDLAMVARLLKMEALDVIKEHVCKVYTVWGIGFLPGFPYIGTLSPILVLPRKATPAPRVAAGSVAIAGMQTGIYPADSPGGWHVIGWTPLKMFDPYLADPCLLSPGDNVRFVAVETHR